MHTPNPRRPKVPGRPRGSAGSQMGKKQTVSQQPPAAAPGGTRFGQVILGATRNGSDVTQVGADVTSTPLAGEERPGAVSTCAGWLWWALCQGIRGLDSVCVTTRA